jgi:hypothetical protein
MTRVKKIHRLFNHKRRWIIAFFGRLSIHRNADKEESRTVHHHSIISGNKNVSFDGCMLLRRGKPVNGGGCFSGVFMGG